MDATKVAALTAELNDISNKINELKRQRKSKQKELDALLNPKEEDDPKANKK